MDNKENHYNGVAIDDFEEQANSAVVYERTRIKPLAEQREEVQKKTFTNWVNSHLKRTRNRDILELVSDLFQDLRDGKVLINLLEVLSGDKLPRPEKGKMRIHCIENVAKCIKFLLSQHVYLENMGAHDIVDGNQTLTLGLIWTIILRYQIQDIQFDEADATTKTPKDALLLWCQMKTAPYHNVNIRNFTTSWKDGLGFSALLHKHKPEVIDFMTMTKETPVENMNTAFDLFEREFDVANVLDPKDILVDQPDEKSIITYVAMIYEKVNKLKETSVQGKRAGKIVDMAIEIDNMEESYETICSDLLEWVNSKIDWMDNEKMKQSLPEVQEQLEQFSSYRLDEKPPKFEIRGSLEMQFFEIQSKLLAAKRKLYIPKEGKLISDINRAWEDLEKAEHRMEIRLYEELIRQQKLQQLGDRFNRKANLREAWLIENNKLVHQDVFGDDLVTVDAAIKKHEALEGDIFAHQERIDMLGFILDELETENYYKTNEIRTRYDEIVALWRTLLEDLQKRRDKLDNCREIQLILQDRSYTMEWINEFIVRFNSTDFGKHLLGVDSLLESHKILLGDARNIDPKIKDIVDRIGHFDLQEAGMDAEEVAKKLDKLNELHQQLLDSANRREQDLLKTRSVWEYLENLDDYKEWIKELNQIMLNPDLGHDLNSVERLLRKHNQVVSDSKPRKDKIESEIVTGLNKVKEEKDSVERRDLLQSSINELQELLQMLDGNIANRSVNLEQSQLYYHLLADIEYNDNSILEEIRIFENTDVGDTLILTEFYLKKHEEQMLQVDELEQNMLDVINRYNDFDKDQLTDDRRQELSNNYDKMKDDFEQLKQQAQIRLDLLRNSQAKFMALRDMDTIETWIVAKEKFLNTLVPSEEVDELNVIKHRFDCFEDEMKNNSNNVESINRICKELINDNIPDLQILAEKIDTLNKDWNDLADLDEGKKRELNMAVNYNQFLIECQATCQWIEDKMKLLEWSDELGDDLDGIMQLQRRLGSLERDVLAIEAKVQYLNNQVPEMKEHKPKDEGKIDDEIGNVNDAWERLKIMLQDRDAKLHSSGQLQKFLQDLDAFNVWLSKVQTTVATLEIPVSLAEAEKNLSLHEQVLEDVKLWEPEFTRLLEFGRHVTDKKDESQYILFSQRLDALEKGWDSLQGMCKDKTLNLKQSIEAQMFFRDSAQVDSILSKQESFLSNEDKPVTLEASQNLEREFEKFKDSVAANRPKIEGVINFGESLLNTNALSEKIGNKCEQIQMRCDVIDEKIKAREKAIQDNITLIMYVEDVIDLEEWISEKLLTATDSSYRELKDVSSRYNRFKDFERELEQSEDRIEGVVKNGEQLMNTNPEFEEVIEPKLQNLKENWQHLKDTTGAKSKEIEEANREVIFQQNAQDMDTWLTQLEHIIITTEETTDEVGLVEINEKMKQQDEKDREFENKKKILEDMEKHAVKLKEQYPDRQEEFEEVQQQVRVKLTQAEAPLISRRNVLEQHKRIKQFMQDVSDEVDWIQKKQDVLENLASPELPDNLQTCQQKERRLHSLQNEVENHQPRIDQVIESGQMLMNEANNDTANKYEKQIDILKERWGDLKDQLVECGDCLKRHKTVREYLMDAKNCLDWIEEREIDLLKDEKVKDLDSAKNSQRKNDDMVQSINDYKDTIDDLRFRHDGIVSDELKGYEKVKSTQNQLENNYDNLLAMCNDRRFRIDDLITLYTLLIIIQDLEEWIAERTIVACSNDAGKNLEFCTLLRDRFSEFARETNEQGGPRVSSADEMCDKLIDQGHQEAAEIARWKDVINEAWSDLLELIETRIQLLKSVWDFYKFMSDSSELIEIIKEKTHTIPETVGRDAKSVAAYLRRHTTFTEEIERIRPQISAQLAVADRLRPLYCGERDDEILERRRQLEEAWGRLLHETETHRVTLMDTSDLYRFLAMVRELLDWYSQIELDMGKEEKPRDCCGVEIIIINHRSLKAELDSRDENRSVCLGLGRTLISNKHRKTIEIRGKCREVITKHFTVVESWRDRKEYLDLILEVYQFAREAAVAEAWLLGQEPQVLSRNYGDDLAETLALLQKHDALERNLAIQWERFESLRRRTKMEQDDMTKQEEEKKRDREIRLTELLREFLTPAPTPEPIRKQVEPVQKVAPIQIEEIVAPVVSDTSQVFASPTTTKDSKPEADKPILPSPNVPQEKTSMLSRKHEWDVAGVKKASSRAWHELFCVFVATPSPALRWFKDEKKWRSDPDTGTYKGEQGMSLSGAQASPALEYKKKGHVMRLRLNDGREYLIQARSDSEMTDWLNIINQSSNSGATSPGPQYSTLPSSRSAAKESSKHKFTTLGRKK